MALRAGFAEVDVTPPLGTKKIGWLRQIAFIQTDTLVVPWTQTADIRRRIEEGHGFPSVPARELKARGCPVTRFLNGALDYGSLGAAIVFSDLPPYRGIVQHDETGLLVENSAQARRSAVLQLLRDGDLRRRLGSAARAFVQEHHAVAKAVDSYHRGSAKFLSYRAPEMPEGARALARRWRG